MNLYHFLFGFQLEKRFGTTPSIRQNNATAQLFSKRQPILYNVNFWLLVPAYLNADLCLNYNNHEYVHIAPKGYQV